MYVVQRVIINGNSTMVTIPRQILKASRMTPGNYVVIELLEDLSIRIRPLRDVEIAKHQAAAEANTPAEPVGA